MNYVDFLKTKSLADPETGITERIALPSYLFPHQTDITQWALRRGRAAIFAGTGLGKTLMELVWAHEVSRYTQKPVLLLAPLAVSHQHEREAGNFGIPARVVSAQSDGVIEVTNYQKIDRFALGDLGGVALDESSILKSTGGVYRTKLINDCRDVPFRLAATATPAPNDFMELGNHSEFLGAMSYTDMLATFFTHDGGDTQKWRLKGHAETEFWKWMASWAVMLRKPSDLGYSDDGYNLPPIKHNHHVVSADYAPSMETGLLFPMEARTMRERLAVRRDTVAERVELAASITPTDRPFVWWCNLNSESSALCSAIPGAVDVTGSDSDDAKEEKLKAFTAGQIRVLVTKPSIAGFGMNWQHCADTGFVGLNDSFEQIYQAERRFWRFGQKKPVTVHFISAETEGAVVANLRRKEADAERMASALVEHMADLSSENIRGMARTRADYAPTVPMTVPSWIGEAS